MNWKIKSRKEIYMVSMVLLLAISCGSNNSASNDPAVRGMISNGGIGELMVLEHLLPSKAIIVDSAYIEDDGSYSFNNFIVEEIGFFRLKKDEQSFITLILEPNDKTVINSDWNMGIAPYEVEGSVESKRLQFLNIRLAKLFAARDSMNKLFQGNPGNEELLMTIQNDFAAMGKDNEQFSRKFILENPSSFACLAAAEYLNPESDSDLLKLVDKEIGKKHENSVYYIEFHKAMAKLDFLAIGTEAPEIILPDPNGEMIKLSSLRGKVVLIDFWASWCKPCRLENPNVVAAYKKYNEKGFEIYGVSLDKSRGNWIQAIETDQLLWTQVSDLKFWQSSVVKLYGITGIPFAVLIDREGKVIAKNLRGDALHQKLEEILN